MQPLQENHRPEINTIILPVARKEGYEQIAAFLRRPLATRGACQAAVVQATRYRQYRGESTAPKARIMRTEMYKEFAKVADEEALLK